MKLKHKGDFMITISQEQLLNIINTTDDLDDLIDKISDMQKELDQDNDQKFEMTR